MYVSCSVWQLAVGGAQTSRMKNVEREIAERQFDQSIEADAGLVRRIRAPGMRSADRRSPIDSHPAHPTFPNRAHDGLNPVRRRRHGRTGRTVPSGRVRSARRPTRQRMI